MNDSGWAEYFRVLRLNAGLSPRDLALRSGLSLCALTRYEDGSRRPSAASARRLAEALGLSRADAAEFFDSLDLPPPLDGFMEEYLVRRRPLLGSQEAINGYGWPCLLNNEFFEVVGWNEAAGCTAELRFPDDLPDDLHRQYLLMSAMGHFEERLENWEEVIGHMIGIWKMDFGDPERGMILSPKLNALLERANVDYPTVLSKVIDLWTAQTPAENGPRNFVKVEWRGGDGSKLRFHAHWRAWSHFDAVTSSDWHPADSTTWAWLERRREEGGFARWAPSSFALGPRGEPGPWHVLLRQARDQLGLSRAEAERRTGVPANTIYSVERGRRRPSREMVVRLMTGMATDAATMNQVLEQLGMEPQPSDLVRWMCGLPFSQAHAPLGRRRAAREVLHEAHGFEWPCFVFDGDCSAVGLNDAAARVLGAGLARPLRLGGSHLIEVVTSPEFIARCQNWDAAITVLLPTSTKPFLNPSTVRPVSGPFRKAVERLRRENPGILRRLTELWSEDAEPRHEARVYFPLRWQAPDGTELAFDCIIGSWNLVDPWWAIDWHPANAETWRWLEARTAASPD